ncbi:Ricin_B-like lectins [Hexamita inflata]|uniref:Ricin B-like lectins n=1 Tax=Hexamita inflata TaxID=28002 RepID=A0AA86Q2F0_9EUKA|nr:Ricin B-like lectins [Hexamita inflata]
MFRIIHTKSGLCLKPLSHDLNSKFALFEVTGSDDELYSTNDTHFIHERSKLVVSVNKMKELELHGFKKYNPKQKWTVEGDYIVNSFFDENIQENMVVCQNGGNEQEKFRIQQC